MFSGTGARKFLTPLFYLILFSTAVRVFLAYFLELGNDEACYTVLSFSPQSGYVDHPPLLPYIINFTTFSGTESSEILVRLSSIIIGIINTILIYLIACKPIFRPRRNAYSSSILTTADYRRGFIAAVLYTASIYATIFIGVLAIPSSLLSLFWLLSISILCTTLPKESRFSSSKMILAGIFIGLAMLSKFTGFYLWLATFIYICLYNRELLNRWSLYASVVISLLIFSPVVLWNLNNELTTWVFIQDYFSSSFNVSTSQIAAHTLGVVLYNGAFNILIIIGALLSYFVGRVRFLSRSSMRFLVVFSLPMILIIFILSFLLPTLPHWSGAAYFALIIVAAAHLSDQSRKFTMKFWQYLTIISSFSFIAVCYAHINYGIFDDFTSKEKVENAGFHKVSLDMYGWRQLSEKFINLYTSDLQNAIVDKEDIVLITADCYDAAHLEVYLAAPNELTMLAIDPDGCEYYYENLTNERLNARALTSLKGYIIVAEQELKTGTALLQRFNLNIESPHETIDIERSGNIVENFRVYRLNPKKYKMIVGTSTEGTSKGIYFIDFDPTNYTNTKLNFTTTENPTFMTFSDDMNYLYAVAENNTNTAAVVSFSFNNSDSLPSLRPISSQLCAGAWPCHIYKGEGWVATANYGGGSISTFRVTENGELSPRTQLIDFNTVESKLTPSHLHCIIPSPSGKMIFATDLGKDSIYRFAVSTPQQIKGGSDILTRLYPAISVTKGSGPRHLTFAPDNKRAYLICELSGAVKCFDYKENTLIEFQSEQSDSVGGGGSADIHISSDGKFLYSSNRLKDDGISIFSINENSGKITKIGYTLTGKHPRNFALSPDENFIFVACRDSDAIEIYRRDLATGLLTYLGKESDIQLDAPMFVKFI